MIAAITSSGSVAVNCGAKVMVLTPFQGRVALPSALHFQLPSGCQECDAAVSHPADSPPVSLLTPDFPRIKLLRPEEPGRWVTADGVRGRMASTSRLEVIEATVFRTISGPVSPWEL